jgi:hypothetical protein
MEDIRNSITLKLRARNSLLFDKNLYPELYPSKEKIIDSIEKDIISLQRLLIERTQKDQKYENFIKILTKIKTISEIVNIIRETREKRTPIYSDIHSLERGVELKYCKRAGLIFSLKEHDIRELFLSLVSEGIDFESLPYFRTATAYLSLSSKYFKTVESAQMSLKPQIRPSLNGLRKRLYTAGKTNDIEIHTLGKQPHRKNVYRLTKSGEIEGQKVFSFASICGLLERDLVETIPFKLQGYRVLNWDKNQGFCFDYRLTKELVIKSFNELNFQTESKKSSNNGASYWFDDSVKRLGIDPSKPIILTEKGERFFQEYIDSFRKNEKIFTTRFNISKMRKLLPILDLIRTSGFLTARECYETIEKHNYRGYGVLDTIHEMLQRNFIAYVNNHISSRLIYVELSPRTKNSSPYPNNGCPLLNSNLKIVTHPHG